METTLVKAHVQDEDSKLAPRDDLDMVDDMYFALLMASKQRVAASQDTKKRG